MTTKKKASKKTVKKSAKKTSRKTGKKKGAGQIPLVILERRLAKLAKIVKTRS